MPLKPEHQKYFWVVWLHEAVIYAARHMGFSFGAVVAVQAWYRLANFVWALLVRKATCVTGKYVDDFFGVGRAGLRYSGGHMMTILTGLLGVATDEAKSVTDALLMKALGTRAILRFPLRAVTLGI